MKKMSTEFSALQIAPMTLKEFAVAWGLKIEHGRINGEYGYFAEHEGEVWAWTHSHAPGGHQFFVIRGGFDEIKAMIEVVGPTKGEW